MQNKESQRASLRARRDVVKSEIYSTLSRLNDDRHAALSDQVHDTKDHSIAQLLMESDDAELRRAAADLADIDAALLRVSADTYGRCLDCGTQVPVARLMAYPTAKRCLNCQQLHEKNQ